MPVDGAGSGWRSCASLPTPITGRSGLPTGPAAGGGGEGNAREKLRAYYERERTSSAKDADPNNPIVHEIVTFIRQGGKRSLCTPRDVDAA